MHNDNHIFSHIFSKIIVIIISMAIAGSMFPAGALAATNELEISGWIPYWRFEEGVEDVRDNLDKLDEVHPFSYSVKENGKLNELADMGDSSWKKLVKEAKKENVRVVPSVMWSDAAAMHEVLQDSKKRKVHISAIVSMVKKGKYDGVDIDYEGKSASTKEYFSVFLKELKKELGSKILSCTIEPRTPLDSLFKIIPQTFEYANDYKEIGTHCDEVKLMTYDQGRADLKLNEVKMGAPYIPVADTDWVRKVAMLAAQSIPKEKLVLGIPTYGYEYQVTVSPNWYQGYSRLWSFNPNYALGIADWFKVTPSRNKAGEMSISYLATSSPIKLSSSLVIPKNTPKGEIIAARALAYANQTGKTVTFNYATWSDAGAAQSKVNMARELGLRGVAFFRFDGGEDEGIWEVME